MPKAFSLIEAVIVLIVVAIALSIVLPQFEHPHKSLESEVSLMKKRIAYAKSQSIQYNAPVAFCGSLDKKTCSKDWSKHQIVFVDLNKNKILDEDENLLRIFSSSVESLVWNGFSSNELLFLPGGINLHHSGHFKFCHRGESIKLIINQTGRIREDMSICENS